MKYQLSMLIYDDRNIVKICVSKQLYIINKNIPMHELFENLVWTKNKEA